MALTLSPAQPPAAGGNTLGSVGGSGSSWSGGAPAAGPGNQLGGGIVPAPGQTSASGPAATDPAYAAYLRQMGVEESSINATTAYRVGALNRSITRQAPIWEQQQRLAGENVDNDFESRGMRNSGNRLQKRTDATTDIAQKRLAWEGDVRDQVGDQYVTTAQDIAEIRRAAAEQALTAGQNTAIANANAGIY